MFGISAFAEAPFASLAGQTVVVALTGVQASGAVGTAAVAERSFALTGVELYGDEGGVGEYGIGATIVHVEAYGYVGTVGVAERSIALTGVGATGAAGTVSFTPTPTGLQAVGSVGAVVISQTVALTGVSASGSVGDVTETNSPTEDGVQAAGAVGTVTMGERFVALNGVSARGQAGTMGEFYWTTIDDSETPNWQNVEMTV